jgi:hypothetical protein
LHKRTAQHEQVFCSLHSWRVQKEIGREGQGQTAQRQSGIYQCARRLALRCHFGKAEKMNIDKLLDVETLMQSCPIPLPAPLRKSFASLIPYFLKKHCVKIEASDVVAVAVDGAGANQFLGAQPEAQIYRFQAEKDGAPIFGLILVGKKPV